MWRFEALSLAKDNQPESAKGAKARAYVEDATWLPQNVVDVAYDFVDDVIRRLKETSSYRKARRPNNKKELGTRSVAGNWAKPGPTAGDVVLADLKQAHPLTKRFWEENLPLQYLEKRISLDELRAECVAGFADLDNFIGWCMDLPELSELPKSIRRTHLAQEFEDLRADAQQRESSAKSVLQGLEPDAKFHNDILKDLRNRLQKSTDPNLVKARANDLEKLYTSNRRWFARHGVGHEAWETRVLGSSLGALPAMDMNLQVAGAQFGKLAVLSKDARKLKHSDTSDLLHSQYLPYVDLFRADNYTRSLIAKIPAAKRTELVSDTLALPKMIRQQAKARHLL